jgi:hypothetical protein
MVKMQSFSFQIEIQIDHDNMLGCDMFISIGTFRRPNSFQIS